VLCLFLCLFCVLIQTHFAIVQHHSNPADVEAGAREVRNVDIAQNSSVSDPCILMISISLFKSLKCINITLFFDCYIFKNPQHYRVSHTKHHSRSGSNLSPSDSGVSSTNQTTSLLTAQNTLHNSGHQNSVTILIQCHNSFSMAMKSRCVTLVKGASVEIELFSGLEFSSAFFDFVSFCTSRLGVYIVIAGTLAYSLSTGEWCSDVVCGAGRGRQSYGRRSRASIASLHGVFCVSTRVCHVI